jgi:hypothetical protein
MPAACIGVALKSLKRFFGRSTRHDVLRIEEVAQAGQYIGELFKRKFACAPPDYPLHYVAFCRNSWGQELPLGYVHYLAFDDSYLCGGLVIDERRYREVSPANRKLIRAAGGIAFALLRETFARLRDAPAIWGYVGDKQSEKVCLRAGFRRTVHPYVMVYWAQEIRETEKAERLARVIAHGPF